MLTPLREAYYFSRNQFQPLFIIALVYAVPTFLIEMTGMLYVNPQEGINLGVLIIAMCLNLLPFASAMLYIDAVSQGHPISIGQALLMAVKKLHWLILLNILLGAIVGVGFLLLIAPGIYFAYKLLFAELYLLLHEQTPMTALKSSYKATTGLMTEILPPLMVWFGATALLSYFLTLLLGPQSEWLPALIQQGIMMLVTLYGWALIYRLYQRYLEAQVPDPDYD